MARTVARVQSSWRPRVAVFGLGGVGRAFLELLHERSVDVALAAAVDSRGALIGDLDPQMVLKKKQEGMPFTGTDGQHVVAETKPDIVVDLTSCDFRTGEPALSIMVAALETGADVITANKAPLARHWTSLHRAAGEAGVRIRYAAACGAALPAAAVASSLARMDRIDSIEGVLTGTAEFVLTEMRSGVTFTEAVRRAQHNGIAERDPSIDVDGWDSAAKLTILANTLWHRQLDLSSVAVTGVAAASEVARGLHLLASATFDGSEVRARVRPEVLPSDHPLSGLTGSDKGVVIRGPSIGTVTVTGGRSHPRGAAAAAFGDMMAAIDSRGRPQADSARRGERV